MRRACIDIGSNTTRLLVADCDGATLIECRQERVFTLIGRSIDSSGAIPVEKLIEVVDAVVAQHASARELGAIDVRCVATAGIRRAANGDALVRLIDEACDGLELEILSGAEEARLAFIGAAWGVGAGTEAGLGVVDAGGGSSELVVGDAPAARALVGVDAARFGRRHRALASLRPAHLGGDRASQAAHAGDLRRLFSRRPTWGGSWRLAGAPPPYGCSPVRCSTWMFWTTCSLRRSDLARSSFARKFGIDVQRARLLAGGLLILELSASCLTRRSRSAAAACARACCLAVAGDDHQ